MAAERKRRTRSHVVADIAARHVELIAARAGDTTLCPPGGGDYGIDVYLFTYDTEGFVENETV